MNTHPCIMGWKVENNDSQCTVNICTSSVTFDFFSYCRWFSWHLSVVNHVGVFFYQIALKGTYKTYKNFLLKCLFLCCIDFEPYSWSHFVSTSRNHCCAFFDKFLTAPSNAKLLAFCGLTVYSGCVFCHH